MPFLLCGLSFLYMRLEDAILVTVHIRIMCTVMETCGYAVRLEDAISVTTHIKSEADYVYGYGKM